MTIFKYGRNKLVPRNAKLPLSNQAGIDGFLTWIAMNWQSVGQALEMPNRVRISIDDYGNRSENRNRCGVKPEVVDETIVALDNIRIALNVVKGSTAIAHQAQALLKSLQHTRDFSVTLTNAHKFATNVHRKRTNTVNKISVCRHQNFLLDDVLGVGPVSLHRVTSVSELKSVGRRLKNCVGNLATGRYYHEQLRTQETEYWTLEFKSKPIALLSVRVENGMRTIIEFAGKKRSSPDLNLDDNQTYQVPGSVLLDVLRCLDVHVKETSNLACFIPFLHVDPSIIQSTYHDEVIDQRHFRVWRFKEDLIIASSDRQPRTTLPAENTRWYRLVRSRTDWNEEETEVRHEWTQTYWPWLEPSQLLELLLRSPNFYEACRRQG